MPSPLQPSGWLRRCGCQRPNSPRKPKVQVFLYSSIIASDPNAVHVWMEQPGRRVGVTRRGAVRAYGLELAPMKSCQSISQSSTTMSW